MDTLDGMRVFARVVEARSFSEAARRLGMSKALVSKYVQQLEARLGVQLLYRTTRALSPTALGQAYHERCLEIVDEVEDLEASLRGRHAGLRGHLRISGPRVFGEDLLIDCVQAFLDRHPEITVDLVLEERTVDLVGEDFDLGVRIGGDLADTSLIARRISSYRYVLCAAPAYLANASTPQTPDALTAHELVVNSILCPTNQLRFIVDGRPSTVTVRPRLRVNGARPIRALVLAGRGVGLCMLPSVRDDIAAGRLVRILEPFEAYERTIHAVYPHRRHLAGRVRAFIDHMIDHFRDGDGDGPADTH